MRRSLFLMTMLNPDGSLRASKGFGFERALETVIKPPCIILVSPTLDRNVGAVARAVLNFGMWDLRVVNPECDIRSELAVALSAGAGKVLENAQVFPDLKSCVADLKKVMSASVRQRDLNHLIYSPPKAGEVLLNYSPAAKTGIVFGRESSGLTNEEIAMTDSILTIPTFTHFSSINLAQSVNIVCYEIWKHRLEMENRSQADEKVTNLDFASKATKEELEYFLKRLEDALEEKDLRRDKGARNKRMLKLKTFFQRVCSLILNFLPELLFARSKCLRQSCSCYMEWYLL